MHQRIGILGGTFYPIHNAHLACAEQVYEACKLDRVLIVPACVPVFKKDQHVTDAAARCEMCKLAIADNPALSLCTLELDRAGDTYTVDTLEELTRTTPDTDFFFIVGMDAFVTLPQWKDATRLAQLATFICVTRPGFTLDANAQKQLDEAGFRYHMVEMDPLDISSTEIRDRVARGESITELVPPAVCDYIANNGLYAASHDKTALH